MRLVGEDFTKGKYRPYNYHRERYLRVIKAKRLAEPKCKWCGKYLSGWLVEPKDGYHAECYNIAICTTTPKK